MRLKARLCYPQHVTRAQEFSVLPRYRRLAAAAILAAVLPVASLAQEAQQPMGGGNATGGAHAAIHDAENRPITAGGFVKSGPIVYQDISQKSGLASWTHVMGTPEKKFI